MNISMGGAYRTTCKRDVESHVKEDETHPPSRCTSTADMRMNILVATAGGPQQVANSAMEGFKGETGKHSVEPLKLKPQSLETACASF